MRRISFVSGGSKIAGHIFLAIKPANVAFLFIQGWTGRENKAAAQDLADLGFTSLTYDMRGNGKSEGDLAALSRKDFIHDATLAYDFLKEQVGPQTAIGVVGSSFGGYTAILLTEQRPVMCLSLRVPANYPDEGFDSPQLAQKIASQDFDEWRHKKLRYSENQALRALHAFKGKVQIIESGADAIVPHQTIQNYVDAIGNKLQLDHAVMEGAPHSLQTERLAQEYRGLLSGWSRQFVSDSV